MAEIVRGETPLDNYRNRLHLCETALDRGFIELDHELIAWYETKIFELEMRELGFIMTGDVK